MSKTIKERYDIINKKIQGAEKVLQGCNKELFMLQNIDCEHPNIVDDYGIAQCPDCGYKTLGWYCPTSPNKECDYYDEKDDIYDEDSCIHCGNPEERK